MNTTVYEGDFRVNETVNGSSGVAPNATSSLTDDQPYPFLLVLLTTLFFSLIITTGLLGNSFVMATLTRWREMQTPCNLLIANICLADIAVCVLAAPLRIIEIFHGWIFGDVMCYVLTPLQDVFVVISVITHTVIALERHRAIVSPFKPKMTLARVKTTVLVIWFASYVTAGVPMVIFLKNQLAGDGNYYCFPVFTKDNFRIAYEMYLVVLFIASPLMLQCAVYFDVIRVLKAKDEIHTRCKSLKSNSSQRKFINDRIQQKKRLVRMLIVLMVVFQMCYLPRGVIMLMSEFMPDIITRTEFIYVELITLAMFYLKHVVNPLILWAMSNDFRAGCWNICSSGDEQLSAFRGSHHCSSSYRVKTKRRLQSSDK